MQTDSLVIIKCKETADSKRLFCVANYKNKPKQNILGRSHFNVDGPVSSMSFSIDISIGDGRSKYQSKTTQFDL